MQRTIRSRNTHTLLLIALAGALLVVARLAGAQQPPAATLLARNGARGSVPTVARSAALTVPRDTQRIAVAAHALARGTVLAANDIAYHDTVTRIPLDSSAVAPGWVTRRVIAEGEALRSPAVEPPLVVMANDPVEAEWTDGGVRLTLRGTATKSAALGERITIRTESGRRIEGTVVAPGRVRID